MKTLLPTLVTMFNERKLAYIHAHGTVGIHHFFIKAMRADPALPWQTEDVAVKIISPISKLEKSIIFPEILTGCELFLLENNLISPKTLREDDVLLDDNRTEIINKIQKAINPDQPTVPIEQYLKEMKNSEKKQKGVLHDYCQRLNLTKSEAADLHMFFSPNRLVAGLTEQEVRLCIMMRKFRDMQNETITFHSPPTSLHESLLNQPDENVSRTEGLKKSIFDLMIEIANSPPTIINS